MPLRAAVWFLAPLAAAVASPYGLTPSGNSLNCREDVRISQPRLFLAQSPHSHDRSENPGAATRVSVGLIEEICMMMRKASKGMQIPGNVVPLLLMLAAVPSAAQTVLNSVETAKKVSAAVVTIHGQTDVG